MKRITPNMTVNFEQFGKAASLPGLILARDWIDEQIRILQNDIAEPREAAPPREIYHEHPKGQFIPGVRASMKGLRRGTEAYLAADAHNKQVIRDARRQTQLDESCTPISDDEGLVSLIGLTGRAREEAKRNNIRIYARRQYAKKKTRPWTGMNAEERSKEMMRRRRVTAENRKRQAKVEAGRRGAALVWSRMTKREQKEKIAKMTAARLAAKAEKAEQLVNGAVN